eukprot:EG_transcript_2918
MGRKRDSASSLTKLVSASFQLLCEVFIGFHCCHNSRCIQQFDSGTSLPPPAHTRYLGTPSHPNDRTNSRKLWLSTEWTWKTVSQGLRRLVPIFSDPQPPQLCLTHCPALCRFPS